MNINEMDEKFKNVVANDNTDGNYKTFKPANTEYVFYDNLTQDEKKFIRSRGMSFDLIGRICIDDELVPKEKLNDMIK